MTRTPVQNPKSGTEMGYWLGYAGGTNKATPDGAGNTICPGPRRLTRESRLMPHHLMSPALVGIAQMGGS